MTDSFTLDRIDTTDLDPGEYTLVVSFEGIETGDLESGRYTVRLRVGDTEREAFLTVVENAETTDDTDSKASGEADTEEPTETDDDDSDGSGPGFGVVSALTGLGGASYLLKRRLSRSLDGEQRD